MMMPPWWGCRTEISFSRQILLSIVYPLISGILYNKENFKGRSFSLSDQNKLKNSAVNLDILPFYFIFYLRQRHYSRNKSKPRMDIFVFVR